MTTRKKITPTIEATVLSRSRRRCCICYGLNRDTKIKQGQIAHLDQNSSNNTEANLAFLCFEHHDLYDSTTRQSKNITKQEVKLYKEELYSHIDKAFSQPVAFGDITVNIGECYTGDYERGGEFESATIAIEYIGKDYVLVSGFALWGKTNKYGPNMGDIDFLTKIENNTVSHTYSIGENTYTISINFLEDKLSVSEKYEPSFFGYFGMNVSFAGEYKRVNY